MHQEMDDAYGAVLFTFLALIISFGILGNVLSFVVWTRGYRCRYLQMGSYFRPLAIADICVLLFPAMELLLFLPPLRIMPRQQNEVLCKLLPFLITPSLRLSTWIVVTFTVERLLHIYLPLRFPCKLNNRRVYSTVAALALVSYGLNVPYLVDFHMLETGRQQYNQSSYQTTTNGTGDDVDQIETMDTDHPCSPRPGSFTATFTDMWEMYFNMICVSIIPFAILLTCNILILAKLSKKSLILNGTLSEQQQTKRNTRFKHATYQVIAASFIRCLTSLPTFILELLLMSSIKNEKPIKFLTEAFYLSNCLSYLDSAVNFFIYCLVGMDFRHDFVEMFRRCRL